MCQFFKTRGYPDSVIHNSKHRARSVHPQTSSQSSHNKHEERIRLTPLTFHPHNILVKNIILKNFKLLQHHPTTAEIFAQPLLISYKRDKNISNFLVNSTLECDHQSGTFKCARARPRNCHFTSTRTKFRGLSELLLSPIIYVHFRQSYPVARQFNLPNQFQKHMALCGLSLHLGNTESRINMEQKNHLPNWHP